MKMQRKRSDFEEEGAPSWPCNTAEPRSCLYLAQGPQIVMSAPGPCVQTGKNCCHPSLRPGPGTISCQQIREEWWDHVWMHASLTHVQSCSYSKGADACRGNRMRALKELGCQYLDETRGFPALFSELLFTDNQFSFPEAFEKGRAPPHVTHAIYPTSAKNT